MTGWRRVGDYRGGVQSLSENTSSLPIKEAWTQSLTNPCPESSASPWRLGWEPCVRLSSPPWQTKQVKGQEQGRLQMATGWQSLGDGGSEEPGQRPPSLPHFLSSASIGVLLFPLLTSHLPPPSETALPEPTDHRESWTFLSSTGIPACVQRSLSGTLPSPRSLHSPAKAPLALKILVLPRFHTQPTSFHSRILTGPSLPQISL